MSSEELKLKVESLKIKGKKMYRFGKKSKEKLATCHPDIIMIYS